MMKKSIIAALFILFSVFTTLSADVWQIKAKSNGKWNTQTISKEDFVQLLSEATIIRTDETNKAVSFIPNYDKTVSYEVSISKLGENVERVKLIHYYQRKEAK